RAVRPCVELDRDRVRRVVRLVRDRRLQVDVVLRVAKHEAVGAILLRGIGDDPAAPGKVNVLDGGLVVMADFAELVLRRAVALVGRIRTAAAGNERKGKSENSECEKSVHGDRAKAHGVPISYIGSLLEILHVY